MTFPRRCPGVHVRLPIQKYFLRSSEQSAADVAGLFVVVDGISCQAMMLDVWLAGGLSSITYSHIKVMVSIRMPLVVTSPGRHRGAVVVAFSRHPIITVFT